MHIRYILDTGICTGKKQTGSLAVVVNNARVNGRG